jgi:hypothetical protein
MVKQNRIPGIVWTESSWHCSCLLAGLQRASFPPHCPLPGLWGEACLALWNNGTKGPPWSCRNLFDRDYCCNESSSWNSFHPSLHKYPWAQALPSPKEPKLGLATGKLSNALGRAKEGESWKHLLSSREGFWAKRKGFRVRVPGFDFVVCPVQSIDVCNLGPETWLQD